MKVHTRIVEGETYEYWYDRAYKAWYAAHVDEIGNLGDAINAYHKETIINAIDDGHCPKVSEVCNG